jgi:hypothetical protein
MECSVHTSPAKGKGIETFAPLPHGECLRSKLKFRVGFALPFSKGKENLRSNIPFSGQRKGYEKQRFVVLLAVLLYSLYIFNIDTCF